MTLVLYFPLSREVEHKSKREERNQGFKADRPFYSFLFLLLYLLAVNFILEAEVGRGFIVKRGPVDPLFRLVFTFPAPLPDTPSCKHHLPPSLYRNLSFIIV